MYIYIYIHWSTRHADMNSLFSTVLLKSRPYRLLCSSTPHVRCGSRKQLPPARGANPVVTPPPGRYAASKVRGYPFLEIPCGCSTI